MIILIENGAPIHRNKLVLQWRVAYGIKKLDWPLNSSELNPIENIMENCQRFVPLP